jgi:hypothetical protein
MTDEKGRPVSFWGGKSVEPIAQPAPVQEPVAWREALERIADPRNTHFAGDAQVVAREALATPPAAQRQWVNLTVDELITLEQKHMRHEDLSQAIEAKLKEKNDAAQPAVQEPVAKSFMVHLYNFGYKAGHHDTVEGRYIDICRQDMETYHLEDVSEWLQDMAYTTPPAQPAPEQYAALEQALTRLQKRYAELEAKVAAQPAVPDALNPKDENPAYAAGWNDCRAEMLKGMK